MVHRDLKPDNVFPTPSGPKLLDFGCRRSEAKTSVRSRPAPRRARYALITAPEQAQGKREVDRRADLYALGVVIFSRRTGERPFEDDSYPMLVLKICTEPPPPVTAYRADLPASFEAVRHHRLLSSCAGRTVFELRRARRARAFESHDTAPRLVARPNSKVASRRWRSARRTEMAEVLTALDRSTRASRWCRSRRRCAASGGTREVGGVVEDRARGLAALLAGGRRRGC
ncbi:MAG: hypothetical protein R3B99_10435 [Polyangiales bacterium]